MMMPEIETYVKRNIESAQSAQEGAGFDHENLRNTAVMLAPGSNEGQRG